MATIKVIETAGATLANLSEEELITAYAQLAETVGRESRTEQHYDNFLQMRLDELREKHLLTRPDITELLIRGIVQLAKVIESRAGGRPWPRPLAANNIFAVPTLAIEGRTGKAGGGDDAAASDESEQQLDRWLAGIDINAVTGGAAAKRPDFRRRFVAVAKKVTRHVVEGALQIRFDGRAIADTGKRMIIVAENNEINVIGLSINTPTCDMQPVYIGKGQRKIIWPRIPPVCISDITTNTNPPKYYRDVRQGLSTLTIPILACDENPRYIEVSDKQQLIDAFDSLAAILQLPTAGIRYRISVGASGVGPLAWISNVSPPAPAPAEQPGIGDNVDAAVAGILRRFESFHQISFSTWFDGSVPADLDGTYLYRMYTLALVRGIDSDAVKEMIARRLQLRALDDLAIRSRKKLLLAKNNVNEHLTIIAKMFPSAVAKINRAIQERPGLAANTAGILKLLKPAEAKAISLAYDANQARIKALVDNKCPHIRIVKDMRHAISDQVLAEKLNELQPFMPAAAIKNTEAASAKQNAALIDCTNCNLPMVCPHVLTSIKADLAGKDFAEMKSILTPFIDTGSAGGQAFCRICGEFITTKVAAGGIDGMGPTPQDDELRKMVWGEIIQLLNSTVVVTTGGARGGLTDLGRLASIIRDIIYPQAAEAERQILKSKTTTADESKARKRLYISIFAIAYLVYLAEKTARGETELISVAPIGLQLKPAKVLNQLISWARNVISTRKNTVIRELPGMTNEQIAALIIDAYGEITSLTSGEVDLDDDDTERGGASNDLIDISYDPVYQWIVNINASDRLGGGGGKHRPGRIELRRADAGITDAAAGIGAAGAKKGRKAKRERAVEVSGMLFAGRHIPSFAPTIWPVKEFMALTPFDATKRSPNIAKMMAGSAAASFRAFNKYLSIPIGETMFIDATASDHGKNSEAVVILTAPFAEVKSEWEKVKLAEKRLWSHRRMASALPYSRHTPVKSRSYDRIAGLPPLGRRFDEDGEEHKWNIFIVGGILPPNPPDQRGNNNSADAAKPATIEMTIKQIDAAAKSATWRGKIVDKKCSVCHELLSNSVNLDETRILDSLNAKYRIDNFFRFYQNRCPAGGLHDFAGAKALACTKCKLAQVQDQRAKLAYYRQYRATYDKDRAEFMEAGKRDVSVAVPPQIDNSWAKSYARWSFKDELALDLATKLGINVRLLTSLGAIEGVEYADVTSGVFIPPEEESRDSTRAYKIDSMIFRLIIEWNQLRFYHRLIKPSAELAAIIESSGISRQNILALSIALGDISDNYNSRYTWFRRNKKPREITQFCIQSFCEMCLRAWDGLATGETADAAATAPLAHHAHLTPLSADATKKLRQDFVKYIVAKTLRIEEMTTKPGHFSWSLIYGDRDTSASEYDINTDRDVDSRDPADDEEERENDDYGDSAAPFGLNDFDMEDADDEGGVIKVGDGALD